jgi:hypothetical protein
VVEARVARLSSDSNERASASNIIIPCSSSAALLGQDLEPAQVAR